MYANTQFFVVYMAYYATLLVAKIKNIIMRTAEHVALIYCAQKYISSCVVV